MDALRGVTDAEREDALSWLVLKVIERDGLSPSSERVQPSYLRRRAYGRILDERERAARRMSQLADDDDQGADDGEPLTAEDRLDALAHRAGGSVWSVFHAPTRDATAAEVSADALADRLAALTGEPLGNAERSAILAALAGYGSGAELAGALGIGAGAARERLRYGPETCATASRRADALADALAAAADGSGGPGPAGAAVGRRGPRRADRCRADAPRVRARRDAAHRTLPGRVGIAGDAFRADPPRR